jgi:hypothetical protein
MPAIRAGKGIAMSSRRNLAGRTARFHGFESLEPRQMMAGNLTANVVSNTLFINEAPGSLGLDQSVQVSLAPNGNVKVDGLFTRSGGQTLINGATSVQLPHALNLVIGTGGGNDQVSVSNVNFNNIQVLAGDPSGTSLADDDEIGLGNVRAGGVVDLRTGGGRDNVFVQHCNIFGDLRIDTGVTGNVGAFDSDGVFIQNTTTHFATIINTGTSADLVRINDSNLGDDKNDFLTINTGAGADTVEFVPNSNFTSVAGNIVVTTFAAENEKDVDTVRALQLVCGSMVVKLGDGNDVVDMRAVRSVSGIGTNSVIQLEGMAGDDTFTLNDIEVLDNFFALMGEGSDTLDMTFVKANVSMKLDGGAGVGTDRLQKHLMPFNPNLTQQNWEFINGIPQLFRLPTGGVLTRTP